MATNNDYISDIVGSTRDSGKTNNQLLAGFEGGGGGGLTPEQLAKLNSIQNGAEVNVNADWDASSGDAFILNKPVIPELGETSTTAYRGDRGKTAYDHTSKQDNPHNVTQQQVGLGNVDNTSDVNKPISSAVTSALNTKADLIDGTVPTSQLPSYVDNVQEYADLVSFPAMGESNVVYLAVDTNKPYRWGGSSYVEISSAGVSLGETSATAYRGDRGAIAYSHTSRVDNPHNVTKAQVGLSSVDNTSDADKPISNAMSSALAGKQDTLVAGDNITIEGNVISSVGSAGVSEMFTAKVLLSPERLKDMRNNPVELIPNPGVNKIINVHSITAFLDFNTTRYNFPISNPTVTISVRYMRPDGSFYPLPSGNFPNGLGRLDLAINSNVRKISKILDSITLQEMIADNCSVVIHSQGANSTVGDSNFTVIINYTVDDFN